jgi:hypothetical protein
MRSETKKGEKMKKSINLKDTKDVKYLCSWNNNDIIQIHTKQTLLNEYKETNLFDDDQDMLFETIGNGFDNFKFKDYLRLSSQDDDFLNVNFICDNMEITRIA